MSDSAEEDGLVTSLNSIARGGGLFTGAFVISNFLGFVTNLLLARLLGTSQYGLYAYANTLVSVFSTIAELGSGVSLQRYLPAFTNDADRQRGIVGLAYATVAIGGTLVAGIVVVSSETISSLTLDNTTFVTTLQILSILIPLDALIRTVSNTFRGIKLPGYHLGVQRVLRPIARLIATGVSVYLGFTITGVVASLVVASGIVLILGLIVLVARTVIRPTLNISKADAVSFYNHSIPLSFSRLGALLYRRADILVVGYFLSATAVGVYNIAVILTQFVVFPVSAVNQIFPAVASQLYSQGDKTELQAVYSIVTRWSLTGALFISVTEIVYRRELLGLFGESFAAGAGVLVIFAVGQAVNAGAGPSNYVLMMTDNQYFVLINQITLGVLNIVLNIYFISLFGILGAAIATASVLALQNIVQVIEIWHFERLFPYSVAYLKPIVAVFLAGGAMYLIQPLFAGLTSILAGGITGTAILGITLLSLGIEEEDRAFIKDQF